MQSYFLEHNLYAGHPTTVYTVRYFILKVRGSDAAIYIYIHRVSLLSQVSIYIYIYYRQTASEPLSGIPGTAGLGGEGGEVGEGGEGWGGGGLTLFSVRKVENGLYSQM